MLIGHIGMGGRATGLYRELAPLRKKGLTESVAVCDVDEGRLRNAAKTVGPQAAAVSSVKS